MLDLSRRIEDQAAKFLRELRRSGLCDNGSNSPNLDEHGQSHAMGGMFNATGKRGVVLSIAGFDSHAVALFRKDLKANTGLTLSQAQADGLLMEARTAMREGKMAKTEDEKRAAARERKARQRAACRARGICIKCCVNAASYREDGSPCATCKDCQDRENARKKAR